VIFYLAWFLERRGRRDSFGINDWNARSFRAGTVLALIGLVRYRTRPRHGRGDFHYRGGLLYVAGLDAKYIAGADSLRSYYYLLIVRVSYRYDRVMAFLNPMADPQGRGFQLLQSLIAVGSGGFTGEADGSKQKLFYLPKRTRIYLRRTVAKRWFHRWSAGARAFRGLRWRDAVRVQGHRRIWPLRRAGLTVMVLSQAADQSWRGAWNDADERHFRCHSSVMVVRVCLVMLVATGVLLNISQQAE